MRTDTQLRLAAVAILAPNDMAACLSDLLSRQVLLLPWLIPASAAPASPLEAVASLLPALAASAALPLTSLPLPADFFS